LSAFRVLHLSDIHIGKTYIKSEEIAYKIVSDIVHNGLCSVRSIIITGDIFDGQVTFTDDLISEAVNFFNIILEQFNLYQEIKLTKEDFIFIPGNHDLIRSDDEETIWRKYNDFLTSFYNKIPEYYNKRYYSVLKVYNQEKVVFIGFNSCQIEKKKVFDQKYIDIFEKNLEKDALQTEGIDKEKLIHLLQNQVREEYEDYGEISSAQISEFERRMSSLDGFNVIALLHHHFYLFPEVAQQYGDSSLVRNHTNFVQKLKYMNVKTVFHGHKHFDLERPYITDDYYETTGSIIDVFSGGSVGTDRKDKHTFSIVDLFSGTDDIKLIHNKFIYNGESLNPIVKKQIPPKNTIDRIIKLLELLESLNHDAYNSYNESSEKLNKIYTTCREIINWTSSAITGFGEIYKYLNKDYKNILFLLYSINYRTLTYKTKDSQFFDSGSLILKDFFNKSLVSSNFDIDINEFHLLFKIKKLKDLANKCDQLLNQSKSKTTKQYLAFCMIGVFFSDLYLVLTEYADDFYNENVKYKVNIKLEENTFHENVPAPRIIIRSEADRRSVCVQLLCNEATAHKIAVLFIKEFDILINKFEDYFKIIGLKLYYLTPKIDKDCFKNALDNYNFEAYIPTLLPLLIGKSIYQSKETFSRELIQNSIDAIAVREAKDSIEFDKKIHIEIGQDENQRRYFLIKDSGTGMDRYKIERYFTSIGRSFYSGDEYNDLNISYKPISNFGIGFLSSFMVCRQIDVRTKYYLLDSEGLKLQIPNYDGCFFIENDNNIDVGTTIKLYLNDEANTLNIVEYIKNVFLDIKYDIIIHYKGSEILIQAHSIRKNDNNGFIFFVPFSGSSDITEIDWEKEVLSGEYVNNYKYGLLITKKKKLTRKFPNDYILNAGILVKEESLNTLFGKDEERPISKDEENCNDIFVNFPANWIQLDVSREKLAGFSSDEFDNKKMGAKIAKAIYGQLLDLINYAKVNDVNVPSKHLQELIGKMMYLVDNNSEIYQKLKNLEYNLNIEIDQNGFTFILGRNEKNDFLEYLDDKDKCLKNMIQCKEEANPILEKFYHIDTSEDFYRINIMRNNRYAYSRGFIPRELYQNAKMPEAFNENIYYMFTFLFIVFISSDKNIRATEKRRLVHYMEVAIMENLDISDVEKGNNRIRINYKDILDLLSKNAEDLQQVN